MAMTGGITRLEGVRLQIICIFFFISTNQKQKLVMAAMFVAESIHLFVPTNKSYGFQGRIQDFKLGGTHLK